MKENDPSYSWNDKIRLTYPPDRCMNKISPISLFDSLYSWMYDSLYTIISLFDSLYSRMYDSLYTMKGGSEIGKPSDEPKRRQYRMSTTSRTPPT